MRNEGGGWREERVEKSSESVNGVAEERMRANVLEEERKDCRVKKRDGWVEV